MSYLRHRNKIAQELPAMHTPVNRMIHLYIPLAVSVLPPIKAPPMGPASTLPRPFCKFNKPKTTGAVPTSFVTELVILAQIAVKPAPKNPYSMPKTISTGKEDATFHNPRTEIAAMAVDEKARALIDAFLSERIPNVNWPQTWHTLITASNNAPL